MAELMRGMGLSWIHRLYFPFKLYQNNLENSDLKLFPQAGLKDFSSENLVQVV